MIPELARGVEFPVLLDFPVCGRLKEHKKMN
jgi:hypothetical protein